jgi:hypothetical protein
MHLDILSHSDPWTTRGRRQLGAQISGMQAFNWIAKKLSNAPASLAMPNELRLLRRWLPSA